MKIPKTVKIGGVYYNVDCVKNAVTIGSKVCYGAINYDGCKIEIDNRFPEQRINQTFLHEVLHGIARERGIELGEKEEEIIDSFAVGLHQLIVDNPKMF